MSIAKSFSLGDKAEAECLVTLELLGFDVEKVPTENRYDYDLKATIGSRSLTFEVKNDVKCALTKNIAIEYFNSKKNEPSGITATKADFWVHKFDKKLWIVKTSKLKEFIGKQQPKRVVLGGGDDNADLYLYDKAKFENICQAFEDIKTSEELFQIYEVSN